MHTSDGTYYELHGRDDAPVVVLIHGLGLCHEIWTPYINYFTKDYRVISYDLYGHGKSMTPGSSVSLSKYATQISNMLDELGIETASIVGFSIGGMINRRFALDYREKLHCQVILNSPHDRGDEAQLAVEERAKMVREQGALATMDAALQRWFTPEFRISDPVTVQRVVDWRQLVDGESYAQAAWVLANGVRELIQPDPPVKARTLVMTCENDTGSTPAMAKAIADEIEGAELQIIPHLQHLGLMEDINVFAEPILEFLGKTHR